MTEIVENDERIGEMIAIMGGALEVSCMMFKKQHELERLPGNFVLTCLLNVIFEVACNTISVNTDTHDAKITAVEEDLVRAMRKLGAWHRENNAEEPDVG